MEKFIGMQDWPFDESNLTEDESTLVLNDGTGREAVTFEFDRDGYPSATTIDNPETMRGNGELTVPSGSYYDGSTYREYIVEIDGDGSVDTFKWSADGGKNFSLSNVEIPTSLVAELSAGLYVEFSDRVSYDYGDQWRIKVYPVNEIVEVERFGSFMDRLAGTKANLIQAINLAYNQGKHSIRARDLEITGNSLGGLPEGASLDHAIELVYDGQYPVISDINVSLSSSPSTGLAGLEYFPEVQSDSSAGTLNLDLRKIADLEGDLLKVRVIGVGDDNSLHYSNARYYGLNHPDRLYAELIEPMGRPATLKIVDIGAGGAITGVEIVDGGVGYDAETWNYEILSFDGSGAAIEVSLDGEGSVTDVTISAAGTNYNLGDVILAKSPATFRIGKQMALRAKVNDPHNELNRVAFYANGVEITDGQLSTFGNEYVMSFTPSSEDLEFITVRALYGDNRDNISATSWERNWETQHCSDSEYLAPSWYWDELSKYWKWPPRWLSSTAQKPGALSLQHSRSTVVANMLTPSATDTTQNNFILGNEVDISVSVSTDFGTIEEVRLFSTVNYLICPKIFRKRTRILVSTVEMAFMDLFGSLTALAPTNCRCKQRMIPAGYQK